MKEPELHPDVIALLRGLLEVADNLERALQAAQVEDAATDPKAPGLADGVRGVHKQVQDLLYRHGVRAFAVEGAAFDPARHEAVGQVRTDRIAARHVVREVRRGYLRGETLFRAAQVLVAAEPTAEQPAVEATGGSMGGPAVVTRPRQRERSAPNRPTWLLHLPPSTDEALYCSGSVSAAASLEEGQRRARDQALRALLGRLGELRAEPWLEAALGALAQPPANDADEGRWDALVAHLPETERWVDDFYWEQVRGEIRGRAYDVAVLLRVPRQRAGAMLVPSQTARERWGGLELVDAGPLLEALGGMRGALLVVTHKGGAGLRAGFAVGDIITRVGLRPTADAASARRLMALSGKQRRPFDVEISRALGQLLTLRVDPSLPR